MSDLNAAIERVERAVSDATGTHFDVVGVADIRTLVEAAQLMKRRDIEAASRLLRAEKAEAERDALAAVIEEAKARIEAGGWPVESDTYKILSRAPEGVLTERDRSIRVEELRESAGAITPPAEVDPETVTTIYDPYDIGDWLRARADLIEKGADDGKQ